jgi:hypothetical protein
MSSRVSASDGSIVRRTIKNRGDAERAARVVKSGDGRVPSRVVDEEVGYE